MGYTIKSALNAGAKIIAENVLEYLRKKTPDKKYYAKHVLVYNEFDNVTLVKVKEKGKGWRRIFPRKIAEIKRYLICDTLDLTTFDENLLPQKTLEELMKGVDINKISFSATFYAIGADDYF